MPVDVAARSTTHKLAARRIEDIGDFDAEPSAALTQRRKDRVALEKRQGVGKAIAAAAPALEAQACGISLLEELRDAGARNAALCRERLAGVDFAVGKPAQQ